MKESKFKITFNSPVVLSFTAICVIVMLLHYLTGGFTTNHFFSVYRSSLLSPFTYIRAFGHIFGHANWSHLIGNMMMILILGPLLEEKYGSSDLIIIIAVTALVTGIAEVIFFPNVQLLGASGVVFAFILLSSITGVKNGEIPLTFILVTVLYIGEQVYQGVVVNDSVSNFTHIVGGVVGASMGFLASNDKKGKSGNPTGTM
ncbi:MAG: rhomboid family intramembrane serine protease [Lachnospiraceae bacterium]|nr:rhomboid family intramembrane serine protease [Lachnospiraceae bacterium]